MDQIATRYSQRPSSLLGLPADSWAAYQLDHAALMLGRWVEGKLSERDEQGQPVHQLVSLLDVEELGSSDFRSLSGRGVRKISIPESGVW